MIGDDGIAGSTALVSPLPFTVGAVSSDSRSIPSGLSSDTNRCHPMVGRR